MKTKKNPKADLNRGSVIFFQIGLIMILSSVYFALEMRTATKDSVDNYAIDMDEEMIVDIPITQMNTPPPPPPPPPPVIPEVIEIVDDELDIKEDVIVSTESNQDDKIEKVAEVSDITEGDGEEEVEQVPFVFVEQVPIFPGCESLKDNEARKKCMTEKIDEFVRNEFNTEVGTEAGVNGISRIIVVFKINEFGKVTDIQSRAPNVLLEEEAERVIKMLPQMKPGMQRNRPVRISYSLPIVFDFRERS
ncbi:energy transducer TonB [Zunongwangia pacifica]|uniref:Energy transducer TonB n=1 Tax=Zunongwangia pacifica TaxID=2911062 RepID=A0A9X2A110_9FLAO|nr:energy transducer TonB [Zunongwangia pacifica]MCL6220091.1 energy transducer TonB [Zunongwangia pacifica]